jgi:predicted porin
MKKSLFAMAAVTAFAGAAQAQSSVTVYGILDVGYTGATSNVVSSAGAKTITNIGRISNSMESGSRIGFRGNEDLGGGTSAQFVFELGIQPAGDAGSNPTGANRATANAALGTYAGQSSATWNPGVRQAFVGLTQKGVGQARIGTQNTLFWEQAGSNTTGQLAQTLGSMLAPTTSGAFFDNGTTTTTTADYGSYTVRTTNTLNVRSERMSGLMAKASYSQSNQTSNQSSIAAGGYTGGVSDQSGWQVALDWNIQKANIQASYANFQSLNPWSTASSTNAAGVTISPAVTVGQVNGWGTGTQGTNVKDTQTLVTASYDFGVLKAYAGWTQRQIQSATDGTNTLTRSAQEIGVRSFVTPKIEGWASAGMGRYNTQGVGGPTANLTGYQVGSNYWMSKRTNLYAIYGANNTSSTSSGSLNASQYSVGVRHTF